MTQLLTVTEFKDRYRISHSQFYREVAKGLPIRKIGRATRIALADAEAWAASLPTHGGEPTRRKAKLVQFSQSASRRIPTHIQLLIWVVRFVDGLAQQIGSFSPYELAVVLDICVLSSSWFPFVL
jgi:hypothetical protein